MVQATPAVIKQIGLPLYPRATLQGDMVMIMTMGPTQTMAALYETSDDLATVRRYYEQRLPAGRRELTLPIGQVTTVSMQFWAKDGQKEVMLSNDRGVTTIELQHMILNAPPSSPSPSASPSATSNSPKPTP